VLAGVDSQVEGNRLLFHITSISPEIEDRIRHNLVSLCHGSHKASSGRRNYSYTRTIKEFLTRYQSKNELIKLGMIGELLAHILIIEFKTNFIHASPFFNMEERSIRKGYDVILFDREKNEIWITEVKSGELHKNKSVNQTCSDLIGRAKRDLIERLNESQTALWQNAINAAMVSLGQSGEFAEIIDNLLHEIDEQYSSGSTSSKDRNVLLTAGLFTSLKSERISTEAVKMVHENVENGKHFKKVITLVFQKGTISRIVDFLTKESEKDEA